jgi:hypothetical protein
MATESDLTHLPIPARRPLRVYAFDPSRGKLLGNEMQIDVRYRSLAPGPVEKSPSYDQIAVVDYDGSRKKYYRPVNLDDPFILIPNGIAPSQTDPRFHQQMVYAVVSDTIEQFERALGRRIHWHRGERPLNAKRGWLADDILHLMLFPHAMQQANAFYSREAHGILFGYFKAGPDDPGHNLPGQTIFTCLSHDILVHETTHAILDGLRGHFMEQTNPDVAAFHEAFADLAALFRHFSHREVLLDAIQRTGGRLYTPAMQGDRLADQAARSGLAMGDQLRNPLIELAGQFGEAIGLHKGLRSAIEMPKTMKELNETTECHERGSVLVAAVFDAFFTVYLQRAAGHFRIFRAAGGREQEDLPAPLADALCNEAMQTADDFFRICVRALDYLPPVDVTFGDFLRAVMTSETEYDPVDREGIRDAWMQAFRRREILPVDARFFSEDALCWPSLEGDDPLHREIEGLPFGGPMGYGYLERKRTAAALKGFLDIRANQTLLELDPRVPYSIASFHPTYRVNRDGSVKWDLVVEIVQTRDATPTTFPIRGGTTMIVSTQGTSGGDGRYATTFLRYGIAKPLSGSEGRRRASRQAEHFRRKGIKPGGKASDLRINFALVHQGA